MAEQEFYVSEGLGVIGGGVIRYNPATSKWELSSDGTTFYDVASASTTLDGLADVSATSPSSGQFLKWNGSAWVNDAVDLGTDTTGNYVNDVVAGTGVTITHTPGEGSSASIAIGQDVGTSSSVTFAHVTAPVSGNVNGNLTGNVTGNASTATALQTSRTISLGGDLSGSASFDGSTNVTISATVQPNSVALGTDTTGNYVADVVAGAGITVTHTPGEGSSASVALNATLDNLSDVNASAPTDGNFLKYVSASSAWIPASVPTINALDDIGDVSASAPSAGQFLQWNGSSWVPAAAGGTVTTTTVSSASETEVFSFVPSSYATAELTVQATQGSKRTSLKALVNHDGAGSTLITTYAHLNHGATAIPMTLDATYLEPFATWTTTGLGFGQSSMYAVAYGAGKWVAAGNYGDLAISTDKVTWTIQNVEQRTVRDIAYLNNQFVGVTNFDYGAGFAMALRSTDGVTWSTSSVGVYSQFANVHLQGVTYGAGKYVAVSEYVDYATSTDAITWTTASLGGQNGFSRVRYLNGHFLASGAGGRLATSTDAVTWTEQSTNMGGKLKDSAYANGIWVVAGYYGAVVTSTDLVTWTQQTTNIGQSNIHRLVYANGNFIATVEGQPAGYVITSTDAITWVSRSTGLSNYLPQGLGYGDNTFMVVDAGAEAAYTYGGSEKVSVGATITDAATTSATVKVVSSLVEA